MREGSIAPSWPLQVSLRAVMALLPVAVLSLLVMWVDAMVGSYAVHLCRWPATISCHHGWSGWQLAPIWFALFTAVCLSGVALWVRRGSDVAHLWPVVLAPTMFPVLVLLSGPRQLAGGDLLVFGLYGTYAVVLSWQVLSTWLPAARKALAIGAVVVVAVQLGVIVSTPTALAGTAEQNGLTRSP